MIQKLFDSEFKVMELIWAKEPVSAKDVALLAEEAYGLGVFGVVGLYQELSDHAGIEV